MGNNNSKKNISGDIMNIVFSAKNKILLVCKKITAWWKFRASHNMFLFDLIYRQLNE